MKPSDYDALKTSITGHEGLKLFPYRDTVGRLTIGYGRNLTDVGISREEASMLLDHDLVTAVVSCQQHFSWFNQLDAARQRVLAEMCFNLGLQGLLEFTRMLQAVQNGHYATAAAEMLRSSWAGQVGYRARRLSSLMQTGSDVAIPDAAPA